MRMFCEKIFKGGIVNNVMKVKIVLVSFLVLVFVFGFVEADGVRDFNDPIVLGDEVPILSDGGENILKEQSEFVMKDVVSSRQESSIVFAYQPPTEKLNSLEQFKNKYGEPWDIRWDEKHGTVESINVANHDVGSKLNSEEDVDKVSRIILKDSKDLFNIDNVDNLEIRDIYHTVINNREFWNIKYYQTYEGIPVYNGYVGLGFRDTYLTGISSRYYSVSVPTTTPKILEEQSIEIAKNLYDVNYNLSASSSLIILPYENFEEESDEIYLVWLVSLNTLHPVISDEVYVDALTGDVLYKQNMLKSVEEEGMGISLIGINLVFIFIIIFIIIVLFIFTRGRKGKIKNFLKLTLAKIISFMVLLLFIPFIKLYEEVIVKCFAPPCFPMLVYQKSQSFLQYLFFHEQSLIYQISYLNLIFGLIFSYLVSCLIVFIINKIKGK